jgi:hypothetical protein
VQSEKGWYDLLDSQCPTFKGMSVGWMAHIWSDEQREHFFFCHPFLRKFDADGTSGSSSIVPGWGIMENGKPKFDFKPRTSC